MITYENITVKDVRYSKGQKMGNFMFDARFQQQ